MNSRIATINSKKSNFCHLSVEKTHWAAAASFSHRSTGFGGNVFTWTASCLTTGLFQHVGEVKTCWVSFSTKMAQHATLYIYRYIYMCIYIYICHLSVIYGFTVTRNTCHRPLCAILVLQKNVSFWCVFSILMAYESTFTGAINLWPPIIYNSSQLVPVCSSTLSGLMTKWYKMCQITSW